MEQYIYLDESGDLGFKFDKPYTQGGSSKYLTLLFLLLPKTKKSIPKRLIKEFYTLKKWDPKREKKGNQLTHPQKLRFCDKVCEILRKHQDIKIKAITVKKKNVKSHIKKDPNLLYNYMTKICIIKDLKEFSEVRFIPDERGIKIESGHSLPNYLQTQLWFEQQASTFIEWSPALSHQNKNLLFTDWLTNIVWHKYEFDNEIYCKKLLPFIESSHLYF